MNGHYLPGAFFTGPSVLGDALDNPSAIHWLHRLFGWLLLAGTIGIWVYLRGTRARAVVSGAALLVAALTFVQFNLGALTVLRHVQLQFAVAHQALAYLVVSSAVFLLHRALGSEKRTR
jgi:cytochrome c oxidase assembly protein subunit 15